MEEREHTSIGKEETALLHEVVDEMFEGFQIIGPGMRYLYVNETVAKQGKKTKDELVGHTMMECYPGIEQTPLFVQLTKCMEERVSAKFENEFTYSDGTTRWFQLYVHPTQASSILILSVDITDRKHIEIELRNKIDDVDFLMDSTLDREELMEKVKKEVIDLKSLLTL